MSLALAASGNVRVSDIERRRSSYGGPCTNNEELNNHCRVARYNVEPLTRLPIPMSDANSYFAINHGEVAG